MEEEWKSIENYPYYEVSNLGNVRSYRDRTVIRNIPHILSPRIDHRGYYFVNLYDANHKMKSIKLHRIVATAFIPNSDNLPQVNHKDENKLNNNVNNLEWCTSKYNVNYGTGHIKSCITRRKCCVRPVLCYDLQNNFIAEYFSVSEAARNLNLCVSCVSKCALGKQNYTGKYKFKFKDN